MDPFYVATMIAVLLILACMAILYGPDPLPPMPPDDDGDGDLDYYGPEDLGDYQAGGRP